MNCITCFETKNELAEINTLGFCTRCAKSYVDEMNVLFYLTGSSTVPTEEFEYAGEKLKLPNFEGYPLSPDESKLIRIDFDKLKNKGALYLGYSAYFLKQRWFSPVIEYEFDDFEGDSDDICSVAAEKVLDADMARIAPLVEKSGGFPLKYWDSDEGDCIHRLTLLLPIDYMMKTFKDFDSYKKWLMKIVDPDAAA